MPTISTIRLSRWEEKVKRRDMAADKTNQAVKDFWSLKLVAFINPSDS